MEEEAQARGKRLLSDSASHHRNSRITSQMQNTPVSPNRIKRLISYPRPPAGRGANPPSALGSMGLRDRTRQGRRRPRTAAPRRGDPSSPSGAAAPRSPREATHHGRPVSGFMVNIFRKYNRDVLVILVEISKHLLSPSPKSTEN